MLFRILAIVAILLFYAIYLQRQFALRRRGIRTNRLGRGIKSRKTRTIEIILLAVSFSMPVVQVWSIVWSRVWFGTAGAIVAFTGVAFFLLAVVAMCDSWRAGIDASQHTEFITHGIYRLSRNPAFVGFDLLYAGIALMFPNLAIISLTAIGVVVFHLQIIAEERYMHTIFGTAYVAYTKKTRRYL